MNNHQAVESLSSAYKAGKLTLYLGSGVSRDNGLPTWPQLVLAMYFRVLEEEKHVGVLRPFTNYLFAFAEWHLDHQREPLEIIARKVRKLFRRDDQSFVERLRGVLYEGFKDDPDRDVEPPGMDPLLAANLTLKAVLYLIGRSRANYGVRSVITYNYDNLLEYAGHYELPQANSRDLLEPLWRAGQDLPEGSIPVYHVHGYVPLAGNGSSASEIVFTEEQYHAAYQDLYSWSNLIQIQAMSSSAGLMIGLSLTDPNMRRLLDAVRRLPFKPDNYVLLRRPSWPSLSTCDFTEIDEKARKYLNRFENTYGRPGIKTPAQMLCAEYLFGEQVAAKRRGCDKAHMRWSELFRPPKHLRFRGCDYAAVVRRPNAADPQRSAERLWQLRHRSPPLVQPLNGARAPVFQSTVLRWAVTGWQIAPIFTAHSGSYFSISTGQDNTLGVVTRPNVITNPTLSNPTIQRWFNTSAFAVPAAGQYGNMGRDTIEGPGFWDLDVALSRNFPLTERQRLDFRAEAFNVLNHARFNNPGSTMTALSSFGVIQSTEAQDPRILQLALKYNF